MGIFGAIAKAALRFARKIVEGVLGQLMQQLNIVQEQAMSPMKAMVEQVVGGIWVGKGADAFVEEINGLLMPNATKITDNINIFRTNVTRAIDVIDQADQQVRGLANGLGDIFDGIF